MSLRTKTQIEEKIMNAQTSISIFQSLVKKHKRENNLNDKHLSTWQQNIEIAKERKRVLEWVIGKNNMR